MRTILLSLLFILGFSLSVEATSPELSFSSKGEFKIMQFTDTHLDPGTQYRLNEGNKTFARISYMVRSEHPDFIVFTGDVVSGRPAGKMWKRLIDSLNVYKVPFCITLGNHDAEQDLSRAEIAAIVTSSPYTLNKLNKIKELADVQINVLGANSKKPALALYCMDSHDYSTIKGIEGYGWFYPEQVQWVKDCCKSNSLLNGGKPVYSLAFFHIVLKEYLDAWRDPNNTHIGRAAEDECPGALNTGMYAAMVETGSFIGTFVGHDHDIDYVVAKDGMALGYGRYSGDDTTYNNLRPGSRIIIIKEGERGFRTYIKEGDGRIVDNIVFAKGKITENRIRK